MSRRYNGRRYRVVRPKRNAERHIRAGSSVIARNTQQTAYTYTATQACVVRSIKLDTGVTTGDTGNNGAVVYALVVVREGYNANALSWPAITSDLYNPTADVLMSGVLTDSAVEDHKANMVGRKLKAGDRLCLIYYYLDGDAGDTQVIVYFDMSFSVLT